MRKQKNVYCIRCKTFTFHHSEEEEDHLLWECNNCHHLLSNNEVDLLEKYEDIIKKFISSPYEKLGRNNVCLCGSEKKFKKCCMSDYDMMSGLIFKKQPLF